MKPFDFAQNRIQERSICRQYVNQRLMWICALFVLTLAVGIGSSRCCTATNTRYASAKLQLSVTRARCKQIDAGLAAAQAELRQCKWQYGLGDLSGRKLSAFQQVIESIPGDVWLDRIQDHSDRGLTIEGGAASYVSVSTLVQRLQASSLGSGATLLGEKAVQSNGTNYVEFSVALQAQDATSKASVSAKPAGVPPPKGGI